PRKGVHGLGPGLITRVADDDLSSNSTYTVTGATWGYRLLWMSLITWAITSPAERPASWVG
ncbi:MAG: hypothetical protein WD628_02210, partial [Thermomicrobiales bacterium]